MYIWPFENIFHLLALQIFFLISPLFGAHQSNKHLSLDVWKLSFQYLPLPSLAT